MDEQIMGGDLAYQRVATLLGRCGSSDAVLPATQLYNEGWILRLVFDWFSRSAKRDHPLAFSSGSRWFSEALLASQFFPRWRGDGRSESWTHADGVIGHFQIGQESKGGLRLSEGATHFVVCEAKLFSALSAGVKNAPTYDQAARNVACMAEVLRRANTHPGHLSRLGFHVIAPQSQIDAGVFAREMTEASMREKVSVRVAQYGGEKDQWLAEWFHPTLQHMETSCISWEELISFICCKDASAGRNIERFYVSCLTHNALPNGSTAS